MEFGVVSPPDEAVRQAAEERHARLTKPRGSLGRLEELGTWLAACQGQCPPRPLSRPRVIVFAGDHGVAAKGVSAYPSEVTAQMVANFQAGGAAINVLAGVAGATVRVVDMSVAVDTAAGTHKVRRSSGAIDHEDALSEEEVEAALAAGRAIADEEVDAGADLLVAGDMGIGNTTPAAVLVAAITGTEPVAVVGRGTGIDDQTWMRKTAAIRDALRRAKPVTADPVALLRTAAGADIAAMAAFLAQAAIRRTPVVLDGVVSGAAALLAEELAPGARAWWVAGHRSTEPSHTLVLEQLDLKPLLEMNMRLGEGSGATAAIPLLTMAVRVLTDMATFEDAGVSGPAEDAATPAEADAAPSPENSADPTQETAPLTTDARPTTEPDTTPVPASDATPTSAQPNGNLDAGLPANAPTATGTEGFTETAPRANDEPGNPATTSSLTTNPATTDTESPESASQPHTEPGTSSSPPADTTPATGDEPGDPGATKSPNHPAATPAPPASTEPGSASPPASDVTDRD